MNAKEVMLALLDGKTLYHRILGMDVKYRLNDDDQIEQITEGDIRTNVVLNWIDGIVEEYPLTFKEAMQEAIKGKRITSEKSIDVYFFNEYGELVVSGRFVEGVINYPIDHEEINAKWRVVE